MRLHSYVRLLALFAFIVACFLPMQVHADSAWNVQTISNSISNCGIALDSHDNPHIAYTEWAFGNHSGYGRYNGQYYVVYSSWNGSIWINQTVAQDASFQDLALDKNDGVHILYKELVEDQRLMYASLTGSGWDIQTVDGAEFIGSLALDSGGRPHVAYIGSNMTLKYTSWTGSSWVNQTIDDVDISYAFSLKIDSYDNPLIIYETEKINTTTGHSLEALKYASFNNISGWTTQTIGQNIFFNTIALDSNGYPHFSSTTEEGLTQISWSGQTWNMQHAGINAVWRENYLAQDKHDYPQIDFVNNLEQGNLLYARWNGAKWQIENITSTPAKSGPIAVDSRGNPHICYFTVSGYLGVSDLYNLMYTTTTITDAQNHSISWIAPFLVAAVIMAVVVLFVWKKQRLHKKK